MTVLRRKNRSEVPAAWNVSGIGWPHEAVETKRRLGFVLLLLRRYTSISAARLCWA